MRFVIPFALIALFEVAALAKAASPAARIQALDPRLERVSWLPSDTRDLSYFPADQSPLLQWVKGSQMPLPPCFNTLSAKLDSHYMVASLSSSNAANIVHGQLDRNALEGCAAAFASMLGMRLRVRRDGPITEFAKEAGGSSFVGWTDDGWAVWHDDRARVQQILRREGTLRGHQALERLIARVNPQVSSRTVGLRC